MTPSHHDLLADSLTKLEISQSTAKMNPGEEEKGHLCNLRVHEGYGFRPPSGISTPDSPTTVASDNLVPDPNGLGWPGTICSTKRLSVA